MGAPSIIPTWATSGSIVQPSSGKQALGWVGGEHPEAEYLNWLFNLTGLWITYFSGLTGSQENDYAPSAWQLTGDAVLDDTVSIGLIKLPDNSGSARLNLGHYPVGAKITTVTFGWHASFSLGQAVMSLKSRPIASSSAAPTTVATNVLNYAAGDQTSTQTWNVTLAAGLAYWIEFANTGLSTNTYFSGATVNALLLGA